MKRAVVLFESALTNDANRQRALVSLRAALVNGGDPEAHFCRRQQFPTRLLAAASAAGWSEAVECLIAAGANVHADSDLALRIAATHGHLPIVKRLLVAGADVHASNDEALMVSVLNNHLPVVERLLAAGADVHADDSAALRWASLGGHVTVVERLLAAGADVHVLHDQALALALHPIQRPDVVRVLLHHGATAAAMWHQLKQHDKHHIAAVLDGMAAEIPVDQRRGLIEQSPRLFPRMHALELAEQRRDRPVVPEGSVRTRGSQRRRGGGRQ